MFSREYFGAAYWTPTYFSDGGVFVPPPAPSVQYGLTQLTQPEARLLDIFQQRRHLWPAFVP